MLSVPVDCPFVNVPSIFLYLIGSALLRIGSYTFNSFICTLLFFLVFFLFFVFLFFCFFFGNHEFPFTWVWTTDRYQISCYFQWINMSGTICLKMAMRNYFYGIRKFGRFCLSCLGPLVYLFPKTLSHLVFQSLDYESSWSDEKYSRNAYFPLSYISMLF